MPQGSSPAPTRMGLVALLGLLLLAAPSQAADAPLWKLGENKEPLEHAPEGAAPQGAQSIRVQDKLLLSKVDFKEQRRPQFPLTGPGDLVWHFALRLPDPKNEIERKRKRRRGPTIVEVDERFRTQQGKYRAHGNQSLRTKGRRATIRSSLLVECQSKTEWFQKGNLVVQSRFNVKSGRLEQASYTFEVTGKGTDGNVRTDVWKGVIRIPAKAKPVRVVSKDFHLEVQTAIDESSAWLERETLKRLTTYKSATKPAHQRVGRLALPVFALLRSGIPPEKLAGCFRWMQSQPLEATYSVALWIMALEARSVKRKALPPKDRTRSVTRFQRVDPPKADRELIRRATEWLIKTRKSGAGWWSYYGNVHGEEAGGKKGPLGHDRKTVATSGDRSNSQFAVLALHSAMASGVEVPAEVWLEVAKEALASQDKKGKERGLGGSQFSPGSPFARDPRDRRGDPNKTLERSGGSTVETKGAQARGWAYGMTRRPKGGAYGSMSAAGTSTVAVAREALKELGSLEEKFDQELLTSLRDGLAWILDNYDVSRNPRRDAAWFFYYTYSLEKAMDTAGVERLGLREWWRDLAAELLARRDVKTKAWATIEDTSFALLVLNRATLPAKLTIGEVERKKTGELDPSAWDIAVVDGVGQLSVRQLLTSMAEDQRGAKDRLELARRAVVALPEPDRPRLVPELAGLLEHRHKATRKWAKASLLRYAGSDEPKQLAGFLETWEQVRLTGESLDYAHVPDLQKVIRDGEASIPLLEHALLVAGRMRALEVVDDMLSQLGSKDPKRRRVVWTHLVSMVEGPPDFDAAAGASERKAQLEEVLAYWKQEGPRQLQAEQIQREVRSLAYPGREKAALAALTKHGRVAVPALIDALRGTGRGKKLAHDLLTKITKQKLPAEAEKWLEWLEAEEKKARK